MQEKSQHHRVGGRAVHARLGAFSPSSVFNNIVALFRFMRDKQAPFIGKALVLTAVAYIVMPADAIPDIAPVVGWLDDMGVALLAMLYLSRVLGPYQNGTPAPLDTATSVNDRAFPVS